MKWNRICVHVNVAADRLDEAELLSCWDEALCCSLYLTSLFSPTDWRQTQGVCHGCCQCGRQSGHSSSWTGGFLRPQIFLFPVTPPTHWPAGWLREMWVRNVFFSFLLEMKKQRLLLRNTDSTDCIQCGFPVSISEPERCACPLHHLPMINSCYFSRGMLNHLSRRQWLAIQ